METDVEKIEAQLRTLRLQAWGNGIALGRKYGMSYRDAEQCVRDYWPTLFEGIFGPGGDLEERKNESTKTQTSHCVPTQQ